MTETARRAPRPPVTRTRAYRILVPVALAVLAAVAMVLLFLAGGVLLGR